MGGITTKLVSLNFLNFENYTFVPANEKCWIVEFGYCVQVFKLLRIKCLFLSKTILNLIYHLVSTLPIGANFNFWNTEFEMLF
jgi:hypothetical protein